MSRHQRHDTLKEDSINLLIEHGLAEGLPRIAELLLNAAMTFGRSVPLGATPFERSDERTGYANGLKDRTFHSSLRALSLRAPQKRDCEEPFKPSMLESGSHVDRALWAVVAKMYLQGGLTRRVTKVMEWLCGLEVRSAQVSRLTAELDETFTQWRERLLPENAHLIDDATYIEVRIDGSVRDCAVLTAIGVRREDGKRMILGVSAKLSEADLYWRDFLVSLKERRHRHPRLIDLRCPRRDQGRTQSRLKGQPVATLPIPTFNPVSAGLSPTSLKLICASQSPPTNSAPTASTA